MIPNIRLRIGLSVFVMLLLLLVLQDLFVLARVERQALAEVDDLLSTEIDEAVLLLGTPQLDRLIDADQQEPGAADEMFFEIRAPDGSLLAASDNLPEGGLGPFRAGGVSGRFWTRTHPDSRKGHRRIRVAEARRAGHWIRVAQALTDQDEAYRALRETLVYALILIAGLGGGLAWWVAQRSLVPLRWMTRRARELEAGGEGDLPRTGSGDELDRLATVLNDLLGRRREYLERMRRMTANAGHALRTPLTTLRGQVELLLQKALPSEVGEIEEALVQVDRLGRIVHGLLTLERLDARRSPASARPLDLAELVDRLVNDLRVVAAEEGIEIRFRSEPAEVLAEPDELREAIANLVDTAIRHSPPGGCVGVEVTSDRRRARVTVVDAGPGIRAADAGRIFERFYSAGPRATGLGLGLPIARSVARAQGGDVTARGGRGGTAFTLELPTAPSEGGSPAP